MNLQNSSNDRSRWAALSFAVAALFGGAAVQAAAFEFNTVMVSGRSDGDPLGPGLGAGIDWDFAEFAVINDAGQVGIQAQLLQEGGVTSSDDDTIWRWQNNSKQLLAREGSQAAAFPPGVLHGSFPGSLIIQIDDAGGILFRDTLGGTANSSNDRAWTVIANDGTATPVAREGDPAPGLAPLAYGSSIFVRDNGPGLADNGNVLFRAFLIGPGVTSENDDALWYGQPGSVSLLIREGDPAPDFSPTAVYAASREDDAYAAGNQIAYIANVLDNGESGSLVVAGPVGATTVLAKSGDIVPGTGSSFGFFNDARINSTGIVTFRASLLDEDDIPQSTSLFTGDQNGLELLAIGGMTAPGTTSEFTNTSSYTNTLADSGDVAFFGTLEPDIDTGESNDTGIWIHDDETTRLAIREGDAAAGLPSVTIGQILHWAFNDQEDLVFVSELEGNVTTGVDDVAMWWLDAAGNLVKLLQTGEQFDVDPTTGIDLRTISTLNLEGVERADGGASRYLTLSDSRRLIFGLGFSDGTSGVFVTQVPEPASLTLVLLSTVAFVAMRMGS